MKKEALHIDKELFSRMAMGEEEAFRQIVHFYYNRFLPATISFVKSEAVAKDIMQTVFLKLWQNRSSLGKVDNPAGWLTVVISRTTSNYMRSQLRYELRKKKMLANEKEEADQTSGQIDLKFAQSYVEEALRRLPAKRKQVFLLSSREGLSRREIALQLNISENTVKNHLFKATSFLQDYLRKTGAFTILTILHELVRQQ